MSKKCFKNCYILGPTGPRGLSETINVRSTFTTDEDNAKVIDITGGPNHLLDFYIPKGKDGTGITFKGTYATVDELLKNHPTGNVGDSYLVNGNLFIWSDNDKKWIDAGKIEGPRGPQGEQGATGPTGPNGREQLGIVYLATFENGTSEGISVLENERIPISRKELDNQNILTLDERENLIYFTRIGAYKVSIVLYGYCKLSSQSFDENKDFISIGLRQLNTDNIYVGASQWIYNEKTLPVIAQGIITVNDNKTPYELVNLSKKTIYLKTPDIANINTNSYFANAPVTIIIDEINSKKS